jgi:hypothetical protein
MLLPALTILSRRNLRRKRYMHNHSHLYTSNHPNLTVFPTLITAPTLAVSLLHLLLHLLVSAAHQLKPRARVLRLPMVFALPAHHRKCALLSRTGRDLHGTATRDHTSTMQILLLLVVLPAELLRQLLPRLLPSKQPVNATTGRRLLRQLSDTANGKLKVST